VLADDRELDLTQREADVAIRMFPARHPDLIQKKLTTVNNSLYASSAYLRSYGTPHKVHELAQHRLIAYAQESRLPFMEVNWLLKAGCSGNESYRPFFKINSLRGIFRAVESGMGIGALPDYMVQDAPTLIKVLPEVEGPKTEVYFIYSLELRNSKRIKVFKEFLIRKLAEDGLIKAA
jgi:DNA-binding transcriptional LysR family regulator